MVANSPPVVGIPSLTVPFVNEQRLLTQQWFFFLQSLFVRTGGNSGVTSIVSTGTIIDFAGTVAPVGYLICDGSELLRTTYSDLFAAIGTTWGDGDGSTTFNIPFLNDKFTLSTSSVRPVGQIGGHTTVTLDVGNLPAHSHPVVDPEHTHTITDPGHHHTALVASSTNTAGAAAGTGTAGNTGDSPTGITIDPAPTGISIGDTGAGDPFGILPPFGVVLKCIKV